MEIRAVDEAFRPELIIFAPALPALGRTTVDGVQRLHGVEICKTELSRDPKKSCGGRQSGQSSESDL